MATSSPGKPIRSKPSTPVSTFPNSRTRRLRGTPRVQNLQSTPGYVDVYTNSPLRDLTSRISPTTRPSTITETTPPAFSLAQLSAASTTPSEPRTDLRQGAASDPFRTTQATAPTATPEHTTPPPARWTGPPGFGVKHINDPISFSLWDPIQCKFRSATREEGREITHKFNADSVGFYGYLMILEVVNPPKPVPLTVACMPAVFTPIGQSMDALPDILGTTGYVNPRGGDACPELGIQRYVSPTKDQMMEVLQALSTLMNIDQITFLPDTILIELVTHDGREYGRQSLPPYASGMTLTYHHSKTPYHKSVQKYARQRLIDPATYIEALESASLPQDETNYLQEANGRLLTPGIRISTGPPSGGQGVYANASQSSSCGVRVKRGTKFLITASHHSFLAGNDVYHPSDNGEKIGEVVHQYPELDIAFVELTPAHAGRFSNDSYFQAEVPRRLAAEGEFTKGTWFEVDTMSTGLMSFLYLGTRLKEPPRPPGHPKLPFHQWRRDLVCRIFGAISLDMMPGMCGASIVEEGTGKVAGFFHLAGGDEAWCAGVDDLIAEGIELA